MAFLTIAGTDYNAVRLNEDEPDRVGDWGRSFNGTLRSSIRAEKRIWQVTLDELSQANYDTLRSTIDNGAFLTVSGEFVQSGGGSVTAVVWFRNAPAVRRKASHNMAAELTIMEV